MSCEKCTTTPTLLQGSCTVYTVANHEFILQKLINILDDFNYSYNDTNGQQLIIDVEDYGAFIRLIGSVPTLTALEKENISILPLLPGEILDFSKFSSARTLDAWFTLYNAKELLWILKNNSITSLFQPIIKIKDMSVYGFECLARGIQQNGDFLNPAVMFSTARKTDLLFNLDRQCRESAIRLAAKHNIDRNIFINFLPSAIYDPKFCLKDTVGWSRKLDFDPYSIIFEVVETEKVNDTEHLINILTFYKEKGFRTALDDVGNGYSSLNLFARLQPNIIKIDLDLIRNIHEKEVNQTVVRALIGMAKESGCKVLAEGVEYKEEFDWLKEQEIDLIQGYFFAKPSQKPLFNI